MKKNILCFFGIVTLLLMLSEPSHAQMQEAGFKNRCNLVVYGGFSDHQQKTNCSYQGLYADVYPFKSITGWNFGVYGNYSYLRFNQGPFQLNNNEVAGGIIIGKYSEYYSTTHAVYTGIALGIKNSFDESQSILANGKYWSQQNDYLLTGNLNLNFLKMAGIRENLLPRTQIVLDAQIPVNSQKVSSWNEDKKWDTPWDKRAANLTIKQSIVNLSIADWLNFTPKFVLNSKYGGPEKPRYGWGLEGSFHKSFSDDFLAFGFRTDKDQKIIYYFSLNIISIFAE